MTLLNQPVQPTLTSPMLRRFYRRFRRTKLFVQNGFFPKVCKRKNLVFLGTVYGGWMIDESLLDASSTVLSFGLGEDISFDQEIIKRFGSRVHGFDPTPKSIAWLKQQELPEQFELHSFGLAGIDGILEFSVPKEEGFASYSSVEELNPANETVQLPVKRISTVLSELKLVDVDILKMDIEGSEYEVIQDLVKSDFRPKQVLVEYHHRIHNTSFDKTRHSIDSLLKAGYELFNISELGDEYSFVYSAG